MPEYQGAEAVFRVPQKENWGKILKCVHKFFLARTGRGLKPKESFVNTYDFLTMRLFGALLANVISSNIDRSQKN